MKKLLLILFICLHSASHSMADVGIFSAKVDAMWLSGDKNGVLTIAEQRLLRNPNDIAGLVLKLQYKIAFFDVDNIKNSIDKVVTEGDKISSSNFAKVYPSFKTGLQYLKSNLPIYNSQQI